ncbi:hypothetical protein [Streptosporangium carneum]|uniref:Uncharacterized protein n=1 Tax=Streptosporangium carneum TaxID=47481 RepID=A0A9W6MBN1_9ACTN|nr:hypothetical protein [Streptosporangium carneum]GLK08217.1 hypothetical protein GCM10017600_16220 [Streptosporangium carneum]
MKPENMSTNQPPGNQGRKPRRSAASPRPRSEPRNRNDLHNVVDNLTQRLEREVERRLLDVSSELRGLLRSEIRMHAARLARESEEKASSAARASQEKARPRRETETPSEEKASPAEPSSRERADLETRLRREMEDRLATIAKERAHLDPNLVLKRFTEHTSALLNKIDGSDSGTLREQLNSGLRQAVLDALRGRKQHLSHLTKIERVVREGSMDQIPQLLDEFFVEAGVRRISDPSEGPEFFKAINDSVGKPYLQVVEPAYVDEATGRILRAGHLRHVAEPQLDETTAARDVSERKP